VLQSAVGVSRPRVAPPSLLQATKKAPLANLSGWCFVLRRCSHGTLVADRSDAMFLGLRRTPAFAAFSPGRIVRAVWAWRGAFTTGSCATSNAPPHCPQHNPEHRISAAFTDSWGWHVLGLPFLTSHLSVLTLAPIHAVGRWSMPYRGDRPPGRTRACLHSLPDGDARAPARGQFTLLTLVSRHVSP
jgi:hypothetical protein